MDRTHWWQSAVIYQIYPRSFQDSRGTGVGDLPGITARLPDLAELGVDAIWISPIFTSPMADYGYDIADYTTVDPLFGDLADFDVLIESAHGLGLKVILDLVPNHTSDQHPWFAESRRSRNSPKRGWYIWHDPGETGGPPNNWLANFGGSAWQYDDRTRQYYYHAFLAAQPDLNWRNPDVRDAVYDAMRFWLRRGVDGFRIDVIWHLIKDDRFRDNPRNPHDTMEAAPHERVLPLYTTDRPEVQEIIAEMRAVANEFIDRVLIGEIYLPVERLVAYYGRDLNGLHLPFNFSLLNSPWNARAIANLIEDYEARLPPGGWPNWVLGNHDRPRIASRGGAEQARVAAMLLLTLRGTPTIYYGDEIGMEQVSIPEHRIRDPLEKKHPGTWSWSRWMPNTNAVGRGYLRGLLNCLSPGCRCLRMLEPIMSKPSERRPRRYTIFTASLLHYDAHGGRSQPVHTSLSRQRVICCCSLGTTMQIGFWWRSISAATQFR
jgi:alpha-glucosidase